MGSNDETVFPDPENFYYRRNNLGLVSSFGHGIHYGVATPLPKLESLTALTILFL
jgi:cytochrome P450